MAEGLKAGEKLGDFEIIEVAGAGGMGIVYKARQQSLDRDVALKVIRDEIAREPEFRERFMREAKLAASVDHPHVVTVYDVGEVDDRLFLTMQWIDGTDLKQLLQQSGRLPPKRAIEIGTQLAGAVDAVHGVSGLVHRDVKPANVLLRKVNGQEHAYLTDFGIAKPPELENLTRTGSTVGTTGYLSPEQIQGKPASPRSDLYSLGCVLFEMITGQSPFSGENDLAVRWAHASDDRPLISKKVPALGERYDAFFLTALAIEPEQRFGSGRDFAKALSQTQSTEKEAAADTGATAILPQLPRAATQVGPATPPPPPGMGPQPTPPPYGYVTPPPQFRDRSGNPLALILLAIVAVIGMSVAALAATGVFSKESSSPLPKTAARAQTGQLAKKPTGPQVPANAMSCESGLWVNSVTTCPFAKNTRSAYAEANGANKISVYSPVTGITYEMACSGASTVVCRGGNNAEVYFTSASASEQSTSAPATAPETSSTSSYSGSLQSCDQNISASEVTSCSFAENVFVVYWEEYERYGEQTYTYVNAFSPTTHKNYGMECELVSDTVDCSGGNEAFVTFPMHAVRVY